MGFKTISTESYLQTGYQDHLPQVSFHVFNEEKSCFESTGFPDSNAVWEFKKV